MKNADILGDGRINYSEFIAATLRSRIKLEEHWIWMAFKKFDVDRTGSITEDNLREAF